jgi:AcrR family transcriptional regulator
MVNDLNANDTKAKIIEVATTLFADHGFDGASVREIAKSAGVNLAAINYHFNSKQNLYQEVLREGICEFEKNIASLTKDKSLTTEELAVSMYDMLIEHGPRLINNFKVLLNNFPLPSDLAQEEKMAGPPGAEHLFEGLAKDLKIPKAKLQDPEKIEDLMWATRVIFTYVAHTALMASTHFASKRCPELLDHKKIIKSIRRLVKSCLNEINE